MRQEPDQRGQLEFWPTKDRVTDARPDTDAVSSSIRGRTQLEFFLQLGFDPGHEDVLQEPSVHQ